MENSLPWSSQKIGLNPGDFQMLHCLEVFMEVLLYNCTKGVKHSVAKYSVHGANKCRINPFHATGLFLYPLKTRGFLKFSGGTERDRWHELG